MGLKQAAPDPTSDPKKRRRVGFSNIDVGVEANECIKIFLVGSKEEVDAADRFCVDPIDLNRFFGEDGRVYGYKDLKINIWLSSVSFHAYADITYQSTSDGGKGITDLKSALQTIFGESLIETKDDFLQTFSKDSHYIRNFISNGEVMHYKAAKGQDNECNTQLEDGAFNLERQVIRLPVNSIPVGDLYSRLVPLVLLLVDDTSRLRISQMLVLPPYQGQGHGRHLLEVLNSVAISDNVYDMAIEEPSDYLQQVRTCIDTLRLLALDSIKAAVNSVASHLKQENLSKKTCKFESDPPATLVEEVRKTLKINKKQLLQCWEILIYLELDPNDHKSMDNYRTLISDRTKADILGKDSGTAGKKVIEVPNDYDHDMTFVMFRPRGSEKIDSIESEVNRNQTNQEEQLNQLVDERIKEVTEIAAKVTLYCG
ncbi:Histone acetyltransferase type B [Macleaya cordata]|uniref:histone acetyltransferase n=1 Tax=Macleaya cordata TaxID=56857 RepID=A0A200QMM4_MACCD|nr:Histone acetyltransferase type B [Macleaya cordata]